MAKIGIDIGHGTNTSGKGVTKNGKTYKEHDFNSKLGIRLTEILKANGHQVFFGQQPFSAEVPLGERRDIYIENGVDLVVSIHANANNNPAVNGRCIFFWNTNTKTKRLAQDIAKLFKEENYSTHGSGTHASKIGSWTNLYITRVLPMDSILIEHGFMTGNKDFDLVFGSKQKEYIEDMAQADAKEIVEFLGGTYKAGKTPLSKAINYYRVQVGAFKDVSGVAAFAQEVENKTGFDSYVTEVDGWMKVQVGAFKNKDGAEKRLSDLKKAGYKDAFITTKSGRAVPETEPYNDPVESKKVKTYNVAVDGYMGPETVRALQDYFGLVVDGEMWGQYRGNQATKAFNQKAVRYGKGGSPVVKSLQKKIGESPTDGIWGAGTTRALQRYLGTPVDGEIWRPSTAIKELQRRLNNGTF